MLVGVMAGDAAHAAEASSDEALIVQTTIKLATMFKLKEPPLPREAIVTRWQSDPFARGSYSYLGPEAQPGDGMERMSTKSVEGWWSVDNLIKVRYLYLFYYLLLNQLFPSSKNSSKRKNPQNSPSPPPPQQIPTQRTP